MRTRLGIGAQGGPRVEPQLGMALAETDPIVPRHHHPVTERPEDGLVEGSGVAERPDSD